MFSYRTVCTILNTVIILRRDYYLFFKKFGNVAKVNMKNKNNELYAFIKMTRCEDAKKAVEGLNNKYIRGSYMDYLCFYLV